MGNKMLTESPPIYHEDTTQKSIFQPATTNKCSFCSGNVNQEGEGIEELKQKKKIISDEVKRLLQKFYFAGDPRSGDSHSEARNEGALIDQKDFTDVCCFLSRQFRKHLPDSSTPP